mgnify:FL=1
MKSIFNVIIYVSGEHTDIYDMHGKLILFSLIKVRWSDIDISYIYFYNSTHSLFYDCGMKPVFISDDCSESEKIVVNMVDINYQVLVIESWWVSLHLNFE